MDILLTFTGFHDPYSKGLIDQEEQPGPILSLLSIHAFDLIYLFDTPSTHKITQETKKAISKLHCNTEVNILEISLDDPTDYNRIFEGLKGHIQQILSKFSGSNFYIAVASGTPQMHACWVLMAAAGEIPARILHVRPPQFVTKDRPLVSEVNLTSREFPSVRFEIGSISPVEEVEVDIDSARIQLGIVGDHPAMKHALEMGAMLAPSQSPILIFGETGTGQVLRIKTVIKKARCFWGDGPLVFILLLWLFSSVSLSFPWPPPFPLSSLFSLFLFPRISFPSSWASPFR